MISSTSLISALHLVPLRHRYDGCCQSSIPNSFLSVSMPWFYPKDEFASLPAIVPRGPIAIFGLGAGTAAHLMLDLWPSLELHGWEIDQILVDKAREYFELSDLEKRTPTGGILHVCVGDALSPSVNVSGGYAGIVVDLFSDGKVLPQLQEVSTWLELHGKLMPNGRFMVNCGAANDGLSDTTSPESWSIDRSWVQNSTIRALCQAFPREVGGYLDAYMNQVIAEHCDDQRAIASALDSSTAEGKGEDDVKWILLNWKKMPKEEGENYVALTGPLPDLATWSAVLPDRLSMTVNQWRPCLPL
ncbi:hypothetical protein RHGRI_006173 [Rhododendron griersonianum]|uniref:S-adenosyl-L-methionine-dependent methyltransferase n=1 Tax=Rhododendron griersonianum TaxID=479676 RepID=A0AAV6LHT3_9ERIC|nr:hypothetical protein RHGRI_006173 [Rhododendron griersonianum]